MAHSSLNAIAGLPALFTLPGYNPIVGPLCMGLLSGIPVLIAGLIFFAKAGKLSFDGADAAAAGGADGTGKAGTADEAGDAAGTAEEAENEQ